jgi:hypothetical protein
MNKKIDLNKFKDVMGQLKTKQQQLKTLMNKETLKEAKKYAEASGKELKDIIKNTDAKKVKSFITKEAKELQKLQKQLPGEIAKFTKFVNSQAKELEKILKTVNALEAADLIQSKVKSTIKGKSPVGKKSKASSKKSSTPAAEAPKVEIVAEVKTEEAPQA